jgi:secondary thiamine-phosphate synthase enzyme
MSVITHYLEISMTGNSTIQNLTKQVQRLLTASGLQGGILTCFVQHTTASVMIIEDEPGIRADTKTFWDRTIPADPQLEHNTRNAGEDNGHSHLRGQLQGPSLTIPFVNGALTLGTWQQLVLIDFDTRPRTRNLVVQLMGE